MRLEPDDLHHLLVRPLLAVALLTAAAGALGLTLPTIGAPLP